jgi:hypothetical protein
VKDVYGEALSNTLEIKGVPGFDEPSASEIERRGKIIAERMEQLKMMEISLHEECREYIRKHQNEEVEVPVPPQIDYRYCAQCDPGIKERYKKEYEEFYEKLTGEENNLVSRLLSIERSWQLFGGESSLGKNSIADSIIKFIMKRMGKKANLLIDKYGNDPRRIGSVIPTALGIERSRQLLGIDEYDENALKMGKIPELAKNFLTYLNKAVDEKDYSIALNPSLILLSYRTYILMGGDEKGLGNLDILQKAVSLNSFKLKIHVSGKLSGRDFLQLAELKGDNYFAAVLDSGSRNTCRLKWVLLGPDPEKKHMQFDLTDVKMQGGGGELVYAGPKKWKSPAPKLRIDFCENGKDTAFISSFRPEGKETWIIPKYGSKDMPLMNNVLLGCFMDIDRLKKENNKVEMTKRMEEMKQQAEVFKQNYSAGQMPSQSDMNSMMRMTRALTAGSMVSDMMQEYAIGSYLILPRPENKSTVIFKQRLNGKELFPENPKIEYAWFDITLEQDPDSPYKLQIPW